MPVDLRSFITTADTAGAQTRLRMYNNGELVTKGTSLKGRAVAWSQEVFGGRGAIANRKATKTFIDLVRSEYGDRVGDTVGQLLRDRLREGKPLCGRHVQLAIATADASRAGKREKNQALARRFADLGDGARGTVARSMVEQKVTDGDLTREEADALLAPDRPHRAALQEAITREVLVAAGNHNQLLGVAPCALATQTKVDEAAHRIQAQMRESTQFANLDDIGGGTNARSMVEKMVTDGALTREEADAMLAPNGPYRAPLQAAIKRAVLDAAARHNDDGFGVEVAVGASRPLVAQEARRVHAEMTAEKLFRPGREDGPSGRVLSVANGLLNDLGIALPDDRALADKMTDQWRTEAAGKIAQALKNNPNMQPDVLDGHIAEVMRPLLTAHVLGVLTAGDESAEAALAKLNLPDNLDATTVEMRMLKGITASLHPKGDDPTLVQVRDAFDAAVIRACRGRFLAQPGDSQKLDELWKGRSFLGLAGIGLCQPSPFGMMSKAGQRDLLHLIADLDEATVTAARAGQSDLQRLLPQLHEATAVRAKQHEPVQAVIDHDVEGAARAARGELRQLVASLDPATAERVADQGIDPADALPDLVTVRIHEITSEHNCGEAEAIDRLLDNNPNLVAHRDRVLAAMSERVKNLDKPADIARTEAVATLADLVTFRIDEIKSQFNCGEAEAIDGLPQTDPDLVDRMDRVLADGGNNPAPRAWLKTRKQLVEMREKVKTAALSGELSGTDLQRLTSAGLRDITENLFENAVKTLDQTPGQFTVLGLGSTARGEASPYSDLEFAILLPNDHSEADQTYATALTQRVHDQIAALGEDGTDWKKEVGFHFDPNLNPITCKALFLNTADSLVANGLGSGGDIEVGGDTDWSKTTFVNAEWFYGSDVRRDNAGRRTEPNQSWQALKDFHAKVAEHLNRRIPADDPRVVDGDVQAGETEGQVLGRWTIALAENWGKSAIQPEKPDVVDVKTLARLPMLLVQGLAVQHGLLRDDEGIAANSIDQRLDLLVEKGRISRQDADEIRNLQDKLSELRVRSHVMHGTQVDKVALTPEAQQREGLLYDANLAGLVERANALSQRVETYLNAPRKVF